MKTCWSILSVFFICFNSCIALAQTDTDEIVVVGNLEDSIPLQLSEYGNRIQIITAEDIELGGFNDISQSLQMMVPGLYLAPKNGAFDYMNCSLQGSRCQDILWLVDGVRINNRLYNTTTPLDTIPVHMVERIEVLYGGQGIFYGTQSVGGVVNVVTRQFSDDWSGSLSVGFDSNDGTHLNVGAGGASGRHQFVAYGSLDTADGFQPFSNSDYQPSGTDRDRGYDVLTLGGKYRFEITESIIFSSLYQHTDNEVEWASPANRARSYNEREEDLLTAKLDYRINDNVALFFKAYYHDWDSQWTQQDNELDAQGQLTGNVITVSDKEYWGFEDAGITSIIEVNGQSGFDYSAGIDHQRYSGRDDVLLIADETEEVNAFFGQIRTNDDLLENTRLAFGIRHNRPSGEGDITVWNLSGQHDFSERLYLRSTIGTSFRFPDAWQLYGNDPCCTLGNPDLEGEKGQNINVALGGTTSFARGFSWELIAFRREIDNLIGSENGIRVNSDSTVDVNGFEISLTAEVGDSLRFGLDYTNTSAQANGSSEQVTDIPESALKVSANYQRVDSPFELVASLVHVGDLYDSVSGGIGRVEHGNYTLLDFGAIYYFDSERKHRVGVRLENAFDEDYGSSLGRAFRDADGSSYAYTNLGTPRTLHGSYTYRF